MIAHTPGPWFTRREGFSTVYIEARIGGGMLQEVAACGPTAAGIGQQKANAQLIAASPELLEALQSLIDMDIAYQRGPKVSDAVDKARAAIAKATGGTK